MLVTMVVLLSVVVVLLGALTVLVVVGVRGTRRSIEGQAQTASESTAQLGGSIEAIETQTRRVADVLEVAVEGLYIAAPALQPAFDLIRKRLGGA